METENQKRNIFQPVVYALLIIAGLLLGRYVSAPLFSGNNRADSPSQFKKVTDVLNYIDQEYVDTINQQQLSNNSIEKILEQLDPHSAFIPAEELAGANEPLEGNFDGIGIEFHIQDDTVMVVQVIPGGPSSEVGLQAGDRIVKVDGKAFTGKKITNKDVMKNLRGPGGSKVKVTVYRRSTAGLRDFTITRGKIPINSIDAAYMVDDITGYIKLNRFGATTYNEYLKAFNDLKNEGMKQLIIDLRGNPGGYMEAAVKLADEFLGEGRMIVYTQGKARPRQDYKATTAGSFEKGKLVMMIDEGSASAAEILSGAMQDWDRAAIVGRRSFGKGLVQEQVELPDGSALRLTVARYYTPTGRSIQKSYAGGYEDYEQDLLRRYKHGEFEVADSIHFADSMKFKTPKGRTVYGGGGIMPDYFVPLDTSYRSTYYEHVVAGGLINQFAFDYVDAHRKELEQFGNIENFKKNFDAGNKLATEFESFSKKQGINATANDITRSGEEIVTEIKAYIARQLYRDNGFYQIYLQHDETYLKALEVIHGNSLTDISVNNSSTKK